MLNTYMVLLNVLAGSDVANISTTAKRDGDYYIVNGAKKWITNGIWADYCTAAVRTGGPGRKGVSMLVIPLKEKGVTRSRMYNSGVNASGMTFVSRVGDFSLTYDKGSTFLEFDDVRVPVSNLIGEENHGFQIIMSSKFKSSLCLIERLFMRFIDFNPERLSLACASLRLARVCAEDAFNYAVQRETFGAPLITRQVIQSKIFKFGLLIEPTQSFMEQLVYIIESSKDRPNDVNIGGMTALLKVMATKALEKTVREAQQILGGSGYNKAGKGARVEQISRDVRVHVVGGGSEEIMMGLALQEELKALKSRQNVMAKDTAKL